MVPPPPIRVDLYRGAADPKSYQGGDYTLNLIKFNKVLNLNINVKKVREKMRKK